jgi:hypothetical protein
MTADTRIFLGDLTRALARAGGKSGENWDAIARLLGFTHAAPATGATQAETPVPGGTAAEGTSPSAVEQPAQPTTEPQASDIGEILDFDLARETAQATPLPQGLSPAVERRRADRLVFRPLLDPLWQRGVLTEAVGRQLAEGDISVVAAVEAVARGESLAEVPRENVHSVSKGCQILIDTGVGMRPFSRDARELVVALRAAVGAEHTRVLRFMDCPTRGVLNESYDDEPYQAPDNGGLVLAVSDLCAGGPASAIRPHPRDWLTIARMVQGAGSLLVVLDPYPPATWPSELSTRLPIIYWDRTTRAADVRRARPRAR